MSKKNLQKIIFILWIIAGLVCIKSIFTDFGGDDAYQLVMSYRHLKGDLMFSQMWEPHQTSIFVNDLLLLIYSRFVPGFTGAALFLQICGTLFYFGICIPLYRTIKPFTNKVCANCICIFLVIFRVKQTPCIEFSNLEIAFSILVFICLIKFVEKSKIIYLILISLLVFLQILSYPTCLISVLAVIAILIIKTEKRVRNCIIFIGSLLALGLSYAGYFIYRIGISALKGIAYSILNSDTHSVRKFGEYWTGFVYAFVGVIAAVIINYIIYRIINRKQKNVVSFFIPFGFTLLIIEVVMIIFSKRIGIDWNSSFYIIPCLLVIMGASCYKKMSKKEKTIWLSGILLSISSFIATLLLTDLGIITILAYLVLGGAVSIIPIKYLFIDMKQYIIFTLCILSLVLFHRGIVVWGYGNTFGDVDRIYEIENVVRSGPTMGIFCNHMTKALSAANARDFERYINPEDTVLIVGGELIDPNDFILTGANISNASVIDTPLYNETLLDYFKSNYDKYPTVVAVSCWFGTPRVDAESWVVSWIEENYEYIGDGDYWRFYRVQ